MKTKKPHEGAEKMTLRVEDELGEGLAQVAKFLGISVNALCVLIFAKAAGETLPF